MGINREKALDVYNRSPHLLEYASEIIKRNEADEETQRNCFVLLLTLQRMGIDVTRYL